MRPKRIAPVIFLSVLCLGPASGETPAQESPPDQPAETPRFPSGVELVNVDVVVTDKKGAPITGLSREAFTLMEDGVVQALTSFEAIQLPTLPSATPEPRPRVSTNKGPRGTGRTFVLVFDDVHLTPFQAQRAKGAIAEFLRTGVREGDRVSLVATGGGAWWSTRMEAGRDELISLLKRLDGRHIPDMSRERMSDYEAMQIHIFRDQQVEQRVSRRFETYGVSQAVQRGESLMYIEGDPIVRGRAAEVYTQAVARNRITLEVLERLLASLAGSKGRKSLILVSEGFIYDPNLNEFKQVVQASRRSNVAMYFLDTRGLGGLTAYTGAEFGPALDPRDMGATFIESFEAAEGAEALAADSGGFAVKNSNDLTKGIQRIANESRSYYLLGYTSTNNKADGRFRKIEVKVAPKGVVVRARKGYYAPLEGGTVVATKKAGSPDPAVQAALDSPFEEEGIPLRMASYVLEETLLGKAGVLVATEVDVGGFSFEEKDGRLLDAVEFLLVVAHRETGEYFRYDQKVEMKLLPETRTRMAKTWFPVVRDFELASGGYQAKIVLREKNTGRIGSVIHDFEVPDLAPLRVSTPVLSDSLQPSPEGQQAAPRPLVVARRTFPAGATLYCHFEVYGAAKDVKTGMPRVTAGYVIRGRSGTVLTQVSPTTINPTSLGRLSRLVGTRLEGASPGDYELVLSLTDEIAGKSLEVHEPFSVESVVNSGGYSP